MKLLFSRNSYITKHGVEITPTYYLFHGSLIFARVSSDPEYIPSYIDVSRKFKFRFEEKICYLQAFDWQDVEHCDKEFLQFVCELKDYPNIWGSTAAWPYGYDKLAQWIPYLANSSKGKNFAQEVTNWIATLPPWAQKKNSISLNLSELNNTIGKNGTRTKQIQNRIRQFISNYVKGDNNEN